jgi:hypothetical protein
MNNEKLKQLKRQVSKLESLCADIKRTIAHIENEVEK